MGSFSLIRGRVMRVTKLDGCGNKVLGPKNSVTSDGFTTVALTANVNEGEVIEVLNAFGKKCISDTPAPQFESYNAVPTFCQVDPEMYTLITGNPVVFAADGTTPVGFDVNSDVDLSTSGFALEMWSMVPSNACVAGQQAWGYFLLPFLQGGTLGDVSIENGAITFTINGAITKDGNAWGSGPYNVVKNVSNVDSPLNTALSTKNHLHLEQTVVTPPTAAGAAQLGVPATTAVAAIPATFTPANSYAPLNLAGAIALPLIASPTTNWTTGQYALMRDGSKINWNGTTWVAGVHA